MGQVLLLLAVCIVAIEPPDAAAQYIFLDSNGDAQCTAADLPVLIDSVDVYIDTNHTSSGATVTCATGEPLTLDGYEFIISSPEVVATWGGYVNKIPQFPKDLGTVSQGNEFRAGWTSDFAQHLPPGKYKLGTVAVQVGSQGGCPYLTFLVTSSMSGDYRTRFMTDCPGRGDYEFILGTDFLENCGLYLICDDVKSTTWGEIKNRYR